MPLREVGFVISRIEMSSNGLDVRFRKAPVVSASRGIVLMILTDLEFAIFGQLHRGELGTRPEVD